MTEKTEKNETTEITGKQVLLDCATLFKHLCSYTVCVTKRACRSIKRLADKNRRKDEKAREVNVDGTSE
ncbi:MAG: hypothetical protein J1G04_00265 [Clostridiales bacterium]|nr:hypothetical protein [Clostridiales bacterium]